MIKQLIASVFILTASTLITSAENTRFNSPLQAGDRLDWCYNWSEGCGQPAANAWCISRGYSRATEWAIAENIGASTPTRLLGTGAVCNQAFCDGFSYITCSRPTVTQSFNNPMERGRRLDWCYAWAQGCGERAANAWCIARGFRAATNWQIANNIGARSPTLIISTGAVCDQASCDGFSVITCTQ